MQGAVDVEEEIVYAAVEDDLQITVFEIVGSMEHGVVLPHGFVRRVVSKVFFDIPVVGEGGEIYTAAGGACCAVKVFVMHGEIEGAMAAHAQARDGAMGAVGYCGIMTVDISDELFADEGF